MDIGRIKFDRKVFDRAVKHVFDSKGFSAEMMADPEVAALINETYKTLDSAIDCSITTETPPELTAALQNNAFIFSGFKTYHSLSEVGLELTDADGHVKPFDQFRSDVEAIDSKYNRNYLYAEYNHAIHTSQMAVKWHDFTKDGDRYNLQYRTAGDERVREAHAALDGTTLPPSDDFWKSYLPPNGWNCRCDVVQVLRDDYPLSDSLSAIAAGDACTEDPKARIFRYNAGQELSLFPRKHPYLPKGCGDCPQKGRLNLFTPVDRGLPACRACGEIMKQCLKNKKVEIAQWKKNNIPERGNIRIEGDNFCTGSMLVTRGSINDTVGHTLNMAVLDSLLGIEKGALKYRYIGWQECKSDPVTGKSKHPEAAFFTYYEVVIAGQIYYANVKAHKDYQAELLYCIRDKCDLAAMRHDAPPSVDQWRK